MIRAEVVAFVEANRAVAVLRLPDEELFEPVAEALHAGGVRVLEITMTTPNALRILRRAARDAVPGTLLGVGSVLDEETAARAVDAGAAFVVSPVMRESIIRRAGELGAAVMPGAFTPTEIQTAWELGADVVKVFPAEIAGMGYFSALRGPLPHLKLMPTGGVTLTNAGDWIRAGACAVGIGGALVSADALASRDFGRIRRNAELLTENLFAGALA